MEISTFEQNYHTLRDECRENKRHRSFQQILSEHALALVDLSIAHAHDSKNNIMRQTEKLTELHLEWQSKITSSVDSLKWKETARKAVRKFPYAVMKLMVVVFPGGGELKRTSNQVGEILHGVSVGAELGAAFHVGWGNLAGSHKEGLEGQYKWYGRMCIKMLAGLRRSGSTSDAFFKAAANSMEAAINIGKSLDGV